jgi:hypothetical protein
VKRLLTAAGQPMRGEGYSRLDLEALRFPDSALVARTFKLCEEVYPSWLLNHCLRAYLWGGLVGQAEGIAVDIEAFLAAALLHDIGLVPGFDTGAEAECFAVRGGLFAEKFLSPGGAPAAGAAAEGICMHLNVSVQPSAGPLNYLLHQGAAIDVLGWGLAKVIPMKSHVLERHPRLEFKRRFSEILRREARAHPRTRLAMMVRFGLLDLIQRAAYDE